MLTVKVYGPKGKKIIPLDTHSGYRNYIARHKATAYAIMHAEKFEKGAIVSDKPYHKNTEDLGAHSFWKYWIIRKVEKHAWS
jgi:hypothetical protein